MMSELDMHGIVIISTELELKEVGTTCVVNFAARTVERTKSRDSDEYESKAHFFNFEIWDTAAKYLVENAKKGDSLVILSATPREHTWVNKSEQKMSKIVMRVNRFKVIPYLPKESVSE